MRSAIFASLIGLAATPALAADGAQLFNTQCRMCHQATTTPMAPALAGIAGGKMAAQPGFNYSPGLKAKGETHVWTDRHLDAYLADPAGFAPGTRMLVKVADPEQRRAIIEYMKTLK
ncbi:MAG: c-type cytochrome [Phenylobacterium sp.]|jgi:cytochrome c|uniref:c-type cytochrome n=1 Tax=Phenylobacterium sp. TaxID=1871053 RepID=UPI002A3590D2|nr:c-type cytochrome [Phenylobacterium sp.]MDX9996619.1 c-type cytochrome [Phenylobacterium sp.]